jgi:hypothetical protein
VIAKPPGERTRFAVSAAARVLLVSVQIMARSAPSPSGGVALAGIRVTCVPRTPSSFIPCALIASTFSRQVSTKVTSFPARDSRLP